MSQQDRGVGKEVAVTFWARIMGRDSTFRVPVSDFCPQ